MPHVVRRMLRDEGGFTLIVVMIALMVLTSVSVAALAAAGGGGGAADGRKTNGDLSLAKRSQDEKAAYAAAEAGVGAFLGHLNSDTSFWSSCDTPAGVTQPGAATSEWQSVAPTSAGRYTVELLPVSPATACDPNNPDGTMIDPANGGLRVRVTGEPSSTSTLRRSAVVTFRRDGFLDYLLWTDYEDFDPRVTARVWACKNFGTGSTETTNSPSSCYATRMSSTDPNTLSWWTNSQCNGYWRDGRGNTAFPGEINPGTGYTNYTTWFRTTYGMPTFAGLYCEEASFGANDAVNGPLHTNDSLRLCSAPITFGRNVNDRIEVEETGQGWRQDPGCSAASAPAPGQWLTGAAHIDPPPANNLTDLQNDAAYSFTGGTKIVFNAPATGKMQITNNGTTQTLDQPANGVIYVGNNGSCAGYDAMFPVVPAGAAGEACGDVAVQGTYTQSMTIAAQDDVVVTDDVIRDPTTPAMLGLIGNNFVRIAHPSTLTTTNTGAPLMPWPHCNNTGYPAAQATDNLTLDAAVLALNGSFLLDRFGCGQSKGTLTFVGAIAQRHRGLVGTSSGRGFVKNYTYDDRLKYRSPPRFLDPVNSAWHIAREVEQNPPAARP